MAEDYPSWIMFGDSITQQAWQRGGLGQHLSEVYQRRMDIVNRGFSGYNSNWALQAAPRILPRPGSSRSLKVLSIWLGANDAVFEACPQFVPLEQFKANLGAMLDLLRSPQSPYHSPATKIVVFGCPPYWSEQAKAVKADFLGPDLVETRSMERAREYTDAARSVATSKNVDFLNVFDKLMEAAGPDLAAGLPRLLHDGLHLSPDGYKVVGDALFELLAAKHPDLLPENLPMPFPLWSEIDPSDYTKAFQRV